MSCNITGHCGCWEDDGADECCFCGMTRDDEYESDWADEFDDVDTDNRSVDWAWDDDGKDENVD